MRYLFTIRSASILPVTEKCIEICYLKHTRKHIFAITFQCQCYEISSILPKNQSKQIIIIIRQKCEKHTWKKFEIFFVNLDVCLSIRNVTMSLTTQVIFPLFCLKLDSSFCVLLLFFSFIFYLVNMQKHSCEDHLRICRPFVLIKNKLS